MDHKWLFPRNRIVVGGSNRTLAYILATAELGRKNWRHQITGYYIITSRDVLTNTFPSTCLSFLGLGEIQVTRQ